VARGAVHLCSPRFRARAGRTLLTYRALDIPGLVHGIGVLKGLAPGMEHAEWADLASGYLETSLKHAPEEVYIPHQVHSARVVDMDRGRGGPLCADGVFTGEVLKAVAVSVSDCIPLFAVNMASGVIGMAHCGWRGIAGGIVGEFVRCLGAKGADPAGTVFLAGAGIGPCCYPVGRDLLRCFRPQEVRDHSKETDGRVVFDLKGVVASRLVEEGAEPGMIHVDETCTSCNAALLASHRAGGRSSGRMLAFLMRTA
jgi:YfiH family protein